MDEAFLGAMIGLALLIGAAALAERWRKGRRP